MIAASTLAVILSKHRSLIQVPPLLGILGAKARITKMQSPFPHILHQLPNLLLYNLVSISKVSADQYIITPMSCHAFGVEKLRGGTENPFLDTYVG